MGKLEQLHHLVVLTVGQRLPGRPRYIKEYNLSALCSMIVGIVLEL